MPNYVKVATVDQVAVNGSFLVEAGGRRLALLNAGGAYFAIADECTHMGGPLSEGTLEGDEVTCPWHGARFNVRTGDAVCAPARGGVACFPVRVNGADLEVQMP